MNWRATRREAGILVCAVLVVVGVGLGAYSLGHDVVPQPEVTPDTIELVAPPATEQPTDASAPPPAPSTVVVYISGAVLNPDTYELPADARVKDVVLAAGGLLDSAARDRINLSEHIADAEHIHIPHTDEPLVAAASATAPTGTSAGNADVINLNTATASELEVLPKVGPALAGRIVAWRTANGPFQSVDDLRKVTGIGPALFDAIKDLVRISQ